MDFIAPISINTNAQLISTNITEADYPNYAAGTTYALDAEVQVVDDGIHRVYRSAVAGNVGHYPPDNIYDDTVDPATGYWIDAGATNAWAMFDGLSRKSSSRADLIVVEFAPGELFNSLALVNVNASTVTVEVIDPIEGLVYSKNVDVVDLSGVVDFYEWFFYPPVRKQTIPLTDLPSYSGAKVKVTLSAPGETVVVGEIAVGVLRYIGKLRYGYSVSIKDYSVKSKDDSGNPTITPGVYSDTGNFKVSIDTNRVYDVKRTLAAHRARSLVVIGSANQQETIIYGYFIDLSVAVETLLKSFCNIEFEELS